MIPTFFDKFFKKTAPEKYIREGFPTKVRDTVGIFLLLVLMSCGNEKQVSENIFRYNQVGGITSLDPAFAKNQANTWAVNQIYNTLLQFDEGLNIQPSLATEWEISEDGISYTFHLRTDVYFQDNQSFKDGKGRQMTAADVVYSFERLLDPEVASTGGWLFRGKVDTVKPFVALDSFTFQLNLLSPFRPMMGILTMQYTSVVPREAIEYYGKEFRRNPLGTGPFRFKSWDENEALILEKNPNYWEIEDGRRLPYIDEVVVSFNENKSTEFLSFLNGDLEFVSDIDPGLKDRVLTLDGDLQERYVDEIDLVRSPYLNLEYFGFIVNSKNIEGMDKAIENEAIRKAINFGFDRKKMIRFLRNNKGIAATKGVIPYGLPAFEATVDYGYEYDPEKAKQILKDAGLTGSNAPVVTVHAPSTYADLAEFMQNQLRQLGIVLNIEVTQGSILRTMMEKGETGFFRASWIADYPDAESFLAMFYSKYDAPPNYTRFQNAAFDRLYELAVKENDDSLRYQYYRQMDSIVMTSAAVVPIYYDEVYRFKQKYVTDLGVNGMNLLVLKNVKLR